MNNALKHAWIVFVALAALAQQQPAATSRGTLSGQVVDAMTGAPIRGAQVQLQGVGETSVWRETTTDASGQFHDAALPPGTYIVRATSQAYPGVYGLQPESLRVVVEAGKESNARVRLAPGGVITGHVLDDDGEPAMNCTVMATRAGSSEQALRNYFGTSAATTNDLGEYRLSDLAADRYYLRVRCPQSLPTERILSSAPNVQTGVGESWQSLYYPDSVTTEGATALVVTPGSETRSIDFKLRATHVVPVYVAVLPPSEGAAGGQVLVQLEPAGASAAGGADAITLTLDSATGYYRANSVAPGNYHLLAVQFGAQGDSGAMGEATLQVGVTPPEPVAVQLQSGSTIKGSVEEPRDEQTDAAALNGDINATLPAMTGMSRGWVQLLPFTPRPFVRGGNAEVQANGSFEMHGVAPGRYRVVYQPRNGPRAVESVEFGGARIDGNEVTVGAATATTLRVWTSAKQTQIRIELDTSATGPSSEMLQVMAIPESGSSGAAQIPVLLNKQGHATMRGVVAGRYRFIALPTSHNGMLDERVLQMLAARAALVTVRGDAELTVRPQRFAGDEIYQLALESLSSGL